MNWRPATLTSASAPPQAAAYPVSATTTASSATISISTAMMASGRIGRRPCRLRWPARPGARARRLGSRQLVAMDRSRRRGVDATAFGRVQHRLEEGARIGDQPGFRREVEADGFRVDAHVDEVRLRADELVGIGDQPAEPGADGEDHVRVAEGLVCVLARVAADGAEGELVGLGDAALAAAARRDRDPEPLGDGLRQASCAGTGGCRCRPGSPAGWRRRGRDHGFGVAR